MGNASALTHEQLVRMPFTEIVSPVRFVKVNATL